MPRAKVRLMSMAIENREIRVYDEISCLALAAR